MFSKAGQIVLASGVVLLALYDAGPKVVGEPCLKRLIGSEADPVPVLPNCNTSGLVTAPCEPAKEGVACTLSYRACAKPNPGIKLTLLCDAENGGSACQSPMGTCKHKRQDRLNYENCNPVIP
jgi:hypothetical protein